MKNFKTTIAFLFCLAIYGLQLSAQCTLACQGPGLTITTELDGTIELNIEDLVANEIDPACGDLSITVTDENGSIIESDTTTFTVDIAISSFYTYEIAYSTGNLCWSSFTLVQGNGDCNLACLGFVNALTESDETIELFIADLLAFSNSSCNGLSILIEGANNTDYSLSTSNDSFTLSLGDDTEFIYTITDGTTGNSCWGNIILSDGCPMFCNDNLNISTDGSGAFTLVPDMLLEGPVNCGDLEIEVTGINNTDFTASGVNELLLNTSDDVNFNFTITNLATGEFCGGELDVLDLTCQDTLYIDLIDSGANVDFVEIDVTALNASHVLSMQWAFLYDGGVLSFAEVEPGAIEDLDGFNFNEVNPGILRFLWLDVDGNTGVNFSNNTVLFTVKFNVLSEGETDVEIGSDDLIFPEVVGPPFNYICLETSPANIITEGAIVTGTINRNNDFTCATLNPIPMENLLVEITDGTTSYFVNTNADGEFSRLVEPGDYTATAFPLNNVWGYCENDVAISLPNMDSEVEIDFLAKADILCPFMEVSVSTPFVRRCFNNTYTVNYCNQGTADAVDASVVIELEDNLDFIDSAHPDYTVDGQFITFNLGTVGFGCESFTFVAYASCDAEQGETHCVFAEILPNDPCGRVLGNYEGAVIELDALCDGDSVRVSINNVSSENMLMQELFIVVEEDVMLQADPYQLNALSSFDFALPANGTTYWINANQPDGFPLAEAASISIEGCGVNDEGTINTGFLNNFSLGDYYPYLDVDCQENIGSFDPNDKNVFPNGFGEEDYIKNNQTLDFKIRFQNTGTDTAFRVVIEDLISPNLDLSTIRRTNYSHRNIMTVTDRLVSFTFDNILLVDSLKNEPESHGFVSFSIDMLPNLEDGVEIKNNADIFFDFNEPIRTNTTHLEIGSEFIDELSDLIEVENTLHTPVKIAPNPTHKNTVLKIMSLENQSLQFSLYDIRGSKVIDTKIHENEIDLSSYALNGGHYLIRLIAEDGKLYVAKVIVN